MAKLYSTLLLALVLSHAAARNIPTDQTTNPNPAENKESLATTSGATATGTTFGDQKTFLPFGGMGSWGGVGGYVGVLPVIGGIGVGGVGGAGGLGGVGGLGHLGGLGKVGGIGVGGGVGGAGGVVP